MGACVASHDLAGLAAAHLRRPGLVVLTGAPGAGRTGEHDEAGAAQVRGREPGQVV